MPPVMRAGFRVVGLMRVVLVGMPGMLRDLVREIAEAEPGVAIVAEVAERRDAPLIIRDVRADFVILGLDEGADASAGEVSEDVSDLLTGNPGLAVLGITSDGKRAYLYEMRPHLVPLGELSPAVLIDVIRGRGSDG